MKRPNAKRLNPKRLDPKRPVRDAYAVCDPIKDVRGLPVIDSLSQVKSQRLVMLSEAKGIIGCSSDSNVRKQVRKGRIRGFRFGGVLVLKRTDCDRYKRLRDSGVFRRGGRPRSLLSRRS